MIMPTVNYYRVIDCEHDTARAMKEKDYIEKAIEVAKRSLRRLSYILVN